MVAFIGTLGPWQIIIVGMMVILLFGVRLLNVLQQLRSQATTKHVPSRLSINALLQIYASVAVLLTAHVVFGPFVALLFSVALFTIVLSRQ